MSGPAAPERVVDSARSRPPGNGVTLVYALVAVMLLVTITASIAAPFATTPIRNAGPLAPLLILVGFFLAERYVFTVEYRRQGVNISLAEVPTAFALIFLAPWLAVVVRLVGAFSARATQARSSNLKLVFNSTLFTAEIALEGWLLRLVADFSSPLQLLAVSALVIALGSLFGGIMVSIAIGAFEGDFVGRLKFELGQGFPVYVLGALLGATAVAPALLNRWLFLLPVLPCIIVWRLLVSRGHLAQKHRDLTELHAFTGAVNRSLDLHEVIEAAQVEGRRLLRAENAALLVFDRKGRIVDRSSTSDNYDALPSNGRDERWREVLDSESPVRLNVSDGNPNGQLLSALNWTEALTVSIRDTEGLLGFFIVADRTGGLKRFSNDDLVRLRPLAEQLAVSLRKGLLHVRMEREATHDRLTGLPNRALFERLVEESLAHEGRTAVFLLDLDRFKEVNDGLGHHVGDLLLQQFALRVRRVLGPDDVLARLAGDEFAVFISGGTDADAIRVGMEIIERGRHTFNLGELSVSVSCSIGLAIGPTDGRDPATLLRRADLAMYKAKARSSGLEIYSSDLDSSSAERLELMRDLREVIDKGQIDVHFQPKVHLATEEVVGAEALVRWHHPRRGLLDAEKFIGLMEQTDLIHTLTDHVLSRALKAARGWRARGWTIGVAVNVSARTLLDELLVDRVARHLETHGLEPSVLTIEITETSVMADVSRALGTLNRLNELGVKLSVDDFGTGYSSLTYLRRLPVSELKIDRAFVAGMLTDKHDHIIVRSTVELGRHLGLRVVAEGIENDLVAHRLRDLGCDFGQGMGFAGPLPLLEFNAWVATYGQGTKRVIDVVTQAQRRASA